MQSILFIYCYCLVFSGIGSMLENKQEIVNRSNKISVKTRKINVCFLIIFIGITFLSAVRVGFVDTVTYRNIYEFIGNDFSTINDDSLRIETGFRFICYLLNFVSNNSQILLIFIALIVNIGVFLTIFRYSEDKWLSLIIYVCTTYLITMNTMRQYLVIAIILLSLPLVFKNKPFPFIIIMILISFIHSTAWVAGLIILLSTGKVLNKKNKLLIIGLFIMAFVPMDQVLEMMNAAGAEEYADMVVTLNKQGVNILRIAVQAVPALLSLLLAYMCRNEDYSIIDNENSLFMNLSIVNFVIYIIALKSNYFARLALYFEIFNVISIPYTINHLFKKQEKSIILIFAIILYSIYFYFSLRAYGDSVNQLTPFFLK